MKRGKMKKINNDHEESNKRTVGKALQQLHIRPTKVEINASYNACVGALGKFREWTLKEVVDYLRNYLNGSIFDFLEDLKMKRRFRKSEKSGRT